MLILPWLTLPPYFRLPTVTLFLLSRPRPNVLTVKPFESTVVCPSAVVVSRRFMIYLRLLDFSVILPLAMSVSPRLANSARLSVEFCESCGESGPEPCA